MQATKFGMAIDDLAVNADETEVMAARQRMEFL